MGEAALLRDTDQAGDRVSGLVGFDIDLHLDAEATALDRAPQDGILVPLTGKSASAVRMQVPR